MNRFYQTGIVTCVAGLLITACSTSPQVARAKYCGPRIGVDDVQVVDLEGYQGSEDEVQIYVQDQVGEYSLLTQKAAGIMLGGSKSNAVAKARRSAAERGCDLLLVLGRTTNEDIWSDAKSPATISYHHYLMVQIGSRKSQASK